jgi:hypothetical protein
MVPTVEISNEPWISIKEMGYVHQFKNSYHPNEDLAWS